MKENVGKCSAKVTIKAVLNFHLQVVFLGSYKRVSVLILRKPRRESCGSNLAFFTRTTHMKRLHFDKKCCPQNTIYNISVECTSELKTN